MSTRTIHKSGRVVAESDTGYHPDGTGPRDRDGKPLATRGDDEGQDSTQATPAGELTSNAGDLTSTAD